MVRGVRANLQRWTILNKLCVQVAVSVLSTNVDKSVDIIVRALYGAAACMVKTVRHKKKKSYLLVRSGMCTNEKKVVKTQLCKFRRTNNREDRKGKNVNDRREYKWLLMRRRKKKKSWKKTTEFDEERLTQLKQHFNNPSKFWETVRSISQKSTMYNSITSEQWYNTSLGFLTRLTRSLKKRIATMLWRMKQQQVYSMNLSL